MRSSTAGTVPGHASAWPQNPGQTEHETQLHISLHSFLYLGFHNEIHTIMFRIAFIMYTPTFTECEAVLRG